MALIPFDDRDGFIWMDGQMLPWREARGHILCHGLHYASSVLRGNAPIMARFSDQRTIMPGCANRPIIWILTFRFPMLSWKASNMRC